MENTVQNWGDAVLVSATEALRNFLGFLPALVGAILVLVVGWILAGLSRASSSAADPPGPRVPWSPRSSSGSSG